MKLTSNLKYYCLSLRLSIFSLSLLLFGFQSFSQAPVANFTATPLSGCSPLVVTFTDQSTGGATSWLWDLGNGVISTDQNPSTIYANPGTYTVILTATNANGSNTITRTNFITVNPTPVPDFNVSVISGCFPLRVQFSDLSDPVFGTIVSWDWNFGNGGTSTLQNPLYVYTTAGSFFVSLTVTNSSGCTKTIVRSNYITVLNGVKADFNFNPAQNCKPPETISFNNLSTGPPVLSYQWDFGDGNISTGVNPNNNYLSAGPFTVRLITTSTLGCVDTLVKTNYVELNNFQPTIGAPDSACVNTPINFQNLSVPLPPNSFWNFGDATTSSQTNPIKTYSAVGTYTIKLVNFHTACSDSVTKTILILPKPTANFVTTDLIACKAPHTVNFQNLSAGGISYEWNFGDGNTSALLNPVHTYTTTGNFTVRLVVTNGSGCTDTLTRAAYIQVQRPVFNPLINPNEGCRLLNVNFQANSTSLDGITSWFWDFGDGNTSTLQNPNHVYDSGSYSIKLRVVTGLGCIDSTRYDSVRVGVKPVAAFSAVPLNVCAFSQVQFTDLSTGNPNQWFWDFGDGNSSILQNPTHTYQDTGLFSIRLFIYNNRCPDTSIVVDYIRVLPPIALFQNRINCGVNKREVIFIDRSVAPLTWNWDFGDGNTSTAQNPSHTYAALGTYFVTLTVTNGSCSHSEQHSFTLVDEAPDFTAVKQTVCRNEVIQFNSINFNAANINSYSWDFGDGTTSTLLNPTHSYTNSGNYTIRLIITDVNNCSDTLQRDNYIRVNGPVASFTINQTQLCLSSNVSLTNTSTTDGANAINRVVWDLGNGDIQNTLVNPFVYLYPAAGNYTIKLTVTDVSGCVDSASQNNLITVLQPKAKFIVDTLSCPGTVLQFTNQSTGGSGAETYTWDFGDGNTSTLGNPTHAYASVGVYAVKLIMSEPIGCLDSMTVNIRIDTPRAAFTINDTLTICQPFEAKFTNNSSYFISSTWDFGDSFTSTDVNPTHFYVVPGYYTIRLIVQSNGGCTDTAYQTIRIGRDTGTINYLPLDGCAPLTVNFQVRTDFPLTYTWDFGDGLTVVTSDSNQVHTYEPGIFIPKIIIKDRLGCSGIIEGIDSIKAYGSIPNFGVDTALFCDRGTVQFIDSSFSSDIITSYVWDFGDGTTSNSFTAPAHTYTAPGLYNVKLTITTFHGCIDSVTKTALIKVVPSPQINISGDTSFCMPASVLLQGQLLNPDTSVVSWRWDIDGQIFNVQNPPPIIRSVAVTIFSQLIATNGTGCTDTAYKTIVVHPLPTVNAGNDTTICLGTFATLNPTGAATYVWSPPTYLNCTNCTNPQASAQNDIQYTVTGTSQYGCVNTDSVFVKVKKPFTILVGPSDTICIGQSTVLHVSGAENYRWSPAGSLNDSTSANPVATPTVTTTYTVRAYDSLNCFQTTATVTVVVYPYPVVNAGRDTTIRGGNPVRLLPQLSADVTSVLWSPITNLSCTTCINPIATPVKTTTYRIIASNPGVCSSFDDVKITVLCDRNSIFIPNAFTPNGDNVNDRFYVMGYGIQNVKSMRVYNRWGNLIFEKTYVDANDPLKGWDGTMNGQPAPPGLFTYTAEIICGDGGIFPVSGTVILIR
ncbi:MAG: PKD domain-containing protein [Lacibacter sp.]